MSKNADSPPLLTLCGLILLAAVSRLLPHPPNFGPIGAIALFGAAALPRKWMTVLVPFAALYLSDLLLNNTLYAAYYDGFYAGFNGWVYAGFALTILLGWATVRRMQWSFVKVGGAAVIATVLFFLVTNFGVWLGSALYPKTAGGLVAAYTAGLPFLLNSLGGNLLFSALLFGGAYYWLGYRDRALA